MCYTESFLFYISLRLEICTYFIKYKQQHTIEQLVFAFISPFFFYFAAVASAGAAARVVFVVCVAPKWLCIHTINDEKGDDKAEAQQWQQT